MSYLDSIYVLCPRVWLVEGIVWGRITVVKTTYLIISCTEKASPLALPACSLYTTLLMKRAKQDLLLISDIIRIIPNKIKNVHSRLLLVKEETKKMNCDLHKKAFIDL